MTELYFPVFGAMAVFLLAVPLLTLAARAAFAAMPGARNSIDAHGTPLRYALVIGPTLGPVLWLVSAAAHQSEEGAALTACLVDHFGDELCQDVVFFGLALAAILGAGAARRAKGPPAPRSETAVSRAITERVRRRCHSNHSLSPFARRIRVVASGRAPVCTRGLMRPVIEIEARVVRKLSDEELEAVLLHELEHARAGDPLRFFVAQVALTVNPLGRLLERELARYCFAREVSCDRRAVQHGADPLSLARSILAVACTRPAAAFGAGLTGHGVDGIKVRVQLLLGYAAQWPGPATPQQRLGLVASAAALLAVLPHFAGTGPLDVLHRGVESLALLAGLG
jgi:Zn-dependent protease with chaperone function